MMIPRVLGKSLTLVALILACFPLQLLLALYLFALRARLHLGRWPSYNNPDPKRLGWRFHHDALAIGFSSAPIVSFVCLVLVFGGRKYEPQFRHRAVIATLLTSWSIFFVYRYFDPYGLLNWFAD
jgi:hypothetical protein